MYKKFLKRPIDIIGAFLLILMLSPVYIFLIVFLSCYYKGTPFFMQRRPGLNNRIFHVIKFKSMIDAFDKAGNPLPNKDRITTVGKILRKTSLDEIPQIFNVLKGDMSFIGPRPLFESYLEYYTDRELLRHSVRPGITGLAQVSGRNSLDWESRLEMDVQYVENLTLASDLKIAFKTIAKVLKSSDISVVPNMPLLSRVRTKQRQSL